MDNTIFLCPESDVLPLGYVWIFDYADHASEETGELEFGEGALVFRKLTSIFAWLKENDLSDGEDNDKFAAVLQDLTERLSRFTALQRQCVSLPIQGVRFETDYGRFFIELRQVE